MKKHFEKDSTSLPWILLVLLALLWGTSFVLIREGLKVYTSTQVATLRISAAFVVLVGITIAKWRHIPLNRVKYLFLSGTLGSFIPAFLFAKAQTQLPSSVAGILNALTPIFTFILGIFFFRQKVSWAKAVGLLLGFVGMAVITFVGKGGTFSLDNVYVFYIVIATFCYGLNLNLLKAYLQDVKSLYTSAASISLIGPMAVVYLFSTDFSTRLTTHHYGWEAFGYVFALGVFGTAVASILFNKLIQISNSLFASSVTYFIPIVAMAWGVIGGEDFLFSYFIGMVFIVGGVFIVNRAK